MDRKIYTTGTLRCNRGEPNIIREAGKQKRLKKGEEVSADNGKVLVIAWQDKRTVKVLSTQHDTTRETV